MAILPYENPTPFGRGKGTSEHAVVFDKARSMSPNPVLSSGLGTTGKRTNLIFSRNERDRKPGTPITSKLMCDPAPDRLERAEALRQKLVAQTNRYKIEGSSDAPARGAYNNRNPNMSKTPVIEKPRSYYVDIAPEDAAIEARRGDEVLYFLSVSDAVRCLTGDRRHLDIKAVQNAASGITASAFGWTWTRHRSNRGGRPRKKAAKL